MTFLRSVKARLGTSAELFAFAWGAKRWWLLPMIVVLLLFAIVVILAQSSIVAPFIYTLF